MESEQKKQLSVVLLISAKTGYCCQKTKQLHVNTLIIFKTRFLVSCMPYASISNRFDECYICYRYIYWNPFRYKSNMFTLCTLYFRLEYIYLYSQWIVPHRYVIYVMVSRYCLVSYFTCWWCRDTLKTHWHTLFKINIWFLH